jgi:hypothetical protein
LPTKVVARKSRCWQQKMIGLWWTPFFGHEKGLFLDGGRH